MISIENIETVIMTAQYLDSNLQIHDSTSFLQDFYSGSFFKHQDLVLNEEQLHFLDFLDSGYSSTRPFITMG